jgi:hypothetical protein
MHPAPEMSTHRRQGITESRLFFAVPSIESHRQRQIYANALHEAFEAITCHSRIFISHEENIGAGIP